MRATANAVDEGCCSQAVTLGNTSHGAEASFSCVARSERRHRGGRNDRRKPHVVGLKGGARQAVPRDGQSEVVLPARPVLKMPPERPGNTDDATSTVEGVGLDVAVLQIKPEAAERVTHILPRGRHVVRDQAKRFA